MLFGLFKKLVLKLLSNLTLDIIYQDVSSVGEMQKCLTLYSFMYRIIPTFPKLYGLLRNYRMVNGLLKLTLVII
jgi:hypothetical protein